MTDKFVPGEVAIYIRPGSPYYGREVTIIGCLRKSIGPSFDHTVGYERESPPLVYDILFHDGKERISSPDWLKKKQPPVELSTWKEVEKICGWNPKVSV